MKLRLRLAVATLGVGLPTMAALLAFDARGRLEAAARRLVTVTEDLLSAPGEQARCEASPATWVPRRAAETGDMPMCSPMPRWIERRRMWPRPIVGMDARAPSPPDLPVDPRLMPVEFFAVDADLRASRPGAPAVERRYYRELASGDAVWQPAWRPWSDTVEVVLKTPWGDGPCAYVAARGHQHGFGGELPSLGSWLLPIAGVMCGVMFAMGPVVRRVRRLTHAVTSSEAAGFSGEIPVEGSDEIAVLAGSFATASRAVRAQLSATQQRETILRDFLRHTTHDVMIPLTVLQAHLATMQEHEQGGRPRDRALLTSAMDEAHYLGALVHNLAAVARLDAGVRDPEMSAVDLNALVHRVVSRHRTIARRLDIAIELAVPDEVVATDADVTLLEEAASNVVYNAVRHNRPGGHVAVILEGAADRFTLRVIDDGPGIPAEELGRLVGRGFRGNDARTRSPDGQGLGLHITFRVAQLHRFDLRFGASEQGGLQVDLEGPRTCESRRA